MPLFSDLDVELSSDALKRKKIDVVVTGSIGAVESPRFVRALRRLGADVQVWLSHGGSAFTTTTSLEWASAKRVRQEFSGSASHLCQADACVIAPASANFIYKLARGITDTPTSALAASYLGAKKPVLILPNMHDSLRNAPAISENLNRVKEWAILLDARQEEGKQKFPEPQILADHVAHQINKKSEHVVVAFGPTRGYIDEVRFISNHSTGELGTLISEEFYRNGFQTHALCGPGQYCPKAYSSLFRFEGIEDLEAQAKILEEKKSNDALIFLPAVLDYKPEKIFNGKMASNQTELNVKMIATEKIIAKLNGFKIKVGFKLVEKDYNADPAMIASEYLRRYSLDLLVFNRAQFSGDHPHQATLFARSSSTPQIVIGKNEIASAIVRNIKDQIS